MTSTDFPSYFIAGDNASLKAQHTYIKLVGWDLGLMIFSALLSIYNYQTEDSKVIIYAVSGLVLLGAMLISIFLKRKRYEDVWYRGRALAESCKTLTWRYIMCSEYFEEGILPEQAEGKFMERIKEINSQFLDLNDSIDAMDVSKPIITGEMIRVRALQLDERRKYYLSKRIQNQIDWYSTKSKSNKKSYEKWFYAVIICQFLAIISIAILIKYPLSDFNLVGLFSTISASGFSWLQLKKYQENKQAYTTAASELNIIKSEGNRIRNSDEFSKYVLDSENAMSREHTMWLAQKRV
jgi:hypothetical protein